MPLRYIDQGLNDIKLKKIRMLGGKIGSMFEEKNVVTVKDAKNFDLQELEHMM